MNFVVPMLCYVLCRIPVIARDFWLAECNVNRKNKSPFKLSLASQLNTALSLAKTLWHPHSAFGFIPGLFGIYTKAFHRECPQQVLPDTRCLHTYSATLSCHVPFFFLFQPCLSTYRQCPRRGAVSSLFYPFVCTDHFDTLLFLLPVRFTPLCTVPATFRGLFGHLQFRKQRDIHSLTR